MLITLRHCISRIIFVFHRIWWRKQGARQTEGHKSEKVSRDEKLIDAIDEAAFNLLTGNLLIKSLKKRGRCWPFARSRRTETWLIWPVHIVILSHSNHTSAKGSFSGELRRKHLLLNNFPAGSSLTQIMNYERLNAACCRPITLLAALYWANHNSIGSLLGPTRLPGLICLPQYPGSIFHISSLAEQHWPK